MVWHVPTNACLDNKRELPGTTLRMTRAPLHFIEASTSATRTVEMSPGEVMASVPWTAP